MIRSARNELPTVAFDDQIFILQQVGGISRYFVNLMHQFTSSGAIGVNFPFHATRSLLLEGDSRSYMRIPGRNRISLAATYLLNTRGRRKLRSSEIMHRTFYHPRYLSDPDGRLVVQTVYDMIPERYPHLFPQGNPHLAKYDHLKQADLILCISDFTRRDLQEYYPGLKARIAITPLGVNQRSFIADRAPVHVDEQFVLFVGRRGLYKDFDTLACAMAMIDSPTITLVAAGGGPLSKMERVRLDQLGLLSRTRQMDVSDEQLQALYRRALVFVFPSYFEGFGLPTLEAMAAGCPVVAAGCSSHPEVGGDAAIYFNPGDPESLASVLDDLLSRHEERRSRSEAGMARSKEFSWARTADLTLSAYRQALGAKHGD